jgi:hypothetical protein
MDRHFSRAAKAILESEGFHAYAHTGIVEAVEVVVAAGREKNPFVSAVAPPPPNSKSRKLLTLRPR